MVKKLVTMTEGEYNSQRKDIEEEIRKELIEEQHNVPIFTMPVALIVFGWLYPKIWLGYSDLPLMTTFASVLALFTYLLMMSQYIIMMRTYIKKNKTEW